MKKYFGVSLFSILLTMMLLTACGQKTDATLEGGNVAEQNEPGKLGDEPVLRLYDMLSSQMNSIELSSGNYTWYMKGEKPDEMQSVIACGVAPLEYAGTEGVTRVDLPDYNGMDGVRYSFYGDVLPDILTVTRWDSSAIGDAEAEPLEVETYTYPDLLIELLPGSVDEFTAKWSEEKLEANGAYGEGSFVLVTE